MQPPDTPDILNAAGLPDVDPLTRLLLRMALQHGTPPEFGLLLEHADLLSRMLAPVAPSVAAGKTDLEFGINGRLDLKINVIAKGTTPTTGLMPLVTRHPQMEEMAKTIARYRLAYQYGVRLTPGCGEVRIYPVENRERVLSRGMLREYSLESVACIPPYRGFGLSSSGAISLYAWSKDQGIRDRISGLTGIRFEQGFQEVLLWEQARFDASRGWTRGKEAVQPQPMPIWIINRAINALQLPYFRYFVNQPGLRAYGYLTRENDYLALYAPLRWG